MNFIDVCVFACVCATLQFTFMFVFKTETAMGVSINALSRPDLEYVKAVKE